MDKKDRISEILDRLQRGDITQDEAAQELSQSANSAKRKPGRPRKKPEVKKNKRGRPPQRGMNTPKGYKHLLIMAVWILFQDKISKTQLRGILADALEVSDTYIGDVITKLNKMICNPKYFIGRTKDGTTAIMVSMKEFRKMQYAAERGDDPLEALANLPGVSRIIDGNV